MKYDVIIIGMGPGGIAAAIYAKRSNLNVLCLESTMPGGILNYIDKIDNYPGLPEITGANFSYRLLEQITALEIPYSLEKVLDISKNDNTFTISTAKNSYETQNIILATGRQAKHLNIPLEEKFLGRGISYCAVCDGAFFKGKDIAVIGGGSSALQEALYLSKTVRKIYLIHRNNHLKADKILIDKVKNTQNIEILYNEEVTKLIGNEYLEQVELKSGQTLDIQGLFIYIGYTPSTSYLQNLDIDIENDYIKTDINHETSIKGIYAIGDIVPKKYYQILSAMNEGMETALNIATKLN